MGAYCAHRISKGSADTGSPAARWRRYYRCTALGHIIQHSRVKPAASAGASFKEHMGELRKKPFHQFVYPQHIAVIHFSLPVRREPGAPYLRKMPVHIPFYIFNVGGRKHSGHLVVDIVPHLFTGSNPKRADTGCGCILFPAHGGTSPDGLGKDRSSSLTISGSNHTPQFHS